MNDTAIETDPALTDACRSALQRAMADTEGMVFALAATVDGFEVASQAAPGWSIPPSRLAAMASSGHALGDTVASELTDAACQNIIVDADRVSVIFLSVPRLTEPRMILGFAATKTASLGSVLVATRTCAREIADTVGA